MHNCLTLSRRVRGGKNARRIRYSRQPVSVQGARLSRPSRPYIVPAYTARLARLKRRLGRQELALLLGLIALFGGAWGFIELAEAVAEQETRALDQAVLLALRTGQDPADPLGPPWMEELARDLTALGSVGVLGLITVGTLAYLLLAGRAAAAAFTATAIGGGWLLMHALKFGYARPRPALVPHETVVYTASFPSGHAMMAAITYLTLAAMLARVQPQRLLRAYLLLMAATVTMLVGASRVYLGVHWPSDVLAGWTGGAAWAALCWLLARWLARPR